MSTALILSALSSRRIASLIGSAKHRVIYAAPGIQAEAAAALAERAGNLAPRSLTVSLDFDEHTLRMGYGKVTDDDIRAWIEEELSAVFPDAEDLILKMILEDRYKDVTFETLNREDFLDSVKNTFPRINWDKAYNEFKAAGEDGSSNKST